MKIEHELIEGLSARQEKALTDVLNRISTVQAPVNLKHQLLHPEQISSTVKIKYLRYFVPALALLAVFLLLPKEHQQRVDTVQLEQVEEIQLAAMIKDDDLLEGGEIDLFDKQFDILEDVL
jgi:hypothetical protein